jgi:hypothetical protein
MHGADAMARVGDMMMMNRTQWYLTFHQTCTAIFVAEQQAETPHPCKCMQCWLDQLKCATFVATGRAKTDRVNKTMYVQQSYPQKRATYETRLLAITGHPIKQALTTAPHGILESTQYSKSGWNRIPNRAHALPNCGTLRRSHQQQPLPASSILLHSSAEHSSESFNLPSPKMHTSRAAASAL